MLWVLTGTFVKNDSVPFESIQVVLLTRKLRHHGVVCGKDEIRVTHFAAIFLPLGAVVLDYLELLHIDRLNGAVEVSAHSNGW